MSLTDAPVPRSFIQSAYPTIKRHNPDLPVLIREANGVPARIFARFGASRTASKVLGLATHFGKIEKGVEQHIVVDNLSPGEITTKFSKLLGL
jgi:NADH dehydrogenase (ubiquinone) 1 alpha subcomplex subunit 2